MQKAFICLLMCVLSASILNAQVMWPEDTIVRESYNFTNDTGVVKAADGSVFTIIYNEKFEHRELCLYKINPDGNPAWQQPVIISSGNDIKESRQMFTHDGESLFVYWRVGLDVYITKLNLQGEFIWNPGIRLAVHNHIWGISTCQDNNGGLYLFYGKSGVPGVSDIWAQHINANGDNQFPGEGVEVSANDGQENPTHAIMRPDGQILFSHRMLDGGVSRHRLMLLSSECMPIWQVFIQSTQGAEAARDLRHVFSINANEYGLLWSEITTSGRNLFYNGINILGQFLLPQSVLVKTNCGDTNATQCTNGDIIISYLPWNDGPNAYSAIKRINPYGNNVWDVEAVLPDSIVSIGLLRQDAADGVDYLIKYQVEDNYSFALQHCSSNGELSYPGYGNILLDNMHPCCNPYLVWDNNYLLLWSNAYQGRHGLYYEFRDSAGVLIGEPHHTLKEVLWGHVAHQALHNRENDVIAIWLDTRYEDNSIFYQIVNPDGSTALEDNGRLICSLSSWDYIHPKSTSLFHDGYTWFFWGAVENLVGNIYGQAIAPNGDFLFGNGGQIFSTIQNVSSMSSLQAYAEGNSIMLAYAAEFATGFQRTYLQKINNNQAIWGVTGMLISPSSSSAETKEYPLAYKNGFLVIDVCVEEQYHTDIEHNIWIQHLDANGQVSASWLLTGVQLCAYTTNGTLRNSPRVDICNNQLFFTYLPSNSYAIPFRFYVVNSEGVILVSNQPVMEGIDCQQNIAIDASNGYAYAITAYIMNTYDSQIVYGKRDYLGNLLWQSNPGFIVSDPDVWGGCVQFTSFSNSAYAISYVSESDLVLRYITPEGMVHPLFEGVSLAMSSTMDHCTAIQNDELYLAWPDISNSVDDNGPYELRMQKFGNITSVGVNDNTVIPAEVRIKCYPNPFAEKCTINFNPIDEDQAEIDIYNLRGQLINRWKMETKPSGEFSSDWDGRDLHGNSVGSGVYFVRIKSGKNFIVKKMLKIR